MANKKKIFDPNKATRLVIDAESGKLSAEKVPITPADILPAVVSAKELINPKQRKITVGIYIKDLILQDKYTNEEIFELAQEQFGIPAKHRYYVAWYRNYLLRQGMNPPPAKRKPR